LEPLAALLLFPLGIRRGKLPKQADDEGIMIAEAAPTPAAIFLFRQ
jgi:hypothetical protein